MAELNWTVISVGSLIVVFPLIFVWLFTYKKYRNSRQSYLLYLSFVWLSAIIMLIGAALANLYLSPTIFLIRNLCIILLSFSVVFLMDSIARNSIDPVKIFIFTILSTLLIIFGLVEESVRMVVNDANQLVFMSTGRFATIFAIQALAVGIYWIYYVFKLFFNSPKSMKKATSLLLLGALFIGIFPGLILGLKLNQYIPGVDNIFSAIGILMTAIILMKENKIAFILPFKALRLLVFDTKGGIPIFFHSWEKSKKTQNDETLFSGILHAIGLLMNESVQRGKVTAINLEQGILILNQFPELPYACVLLATQNSHTLTRSMNQFIKRFIEEFKPYLKDTPDLEKIDNADKLIEECFAFLPEYD